MSEIISKYELKIYFCGAGPSFGSPETSILLSIQALMALSKERQASRQSWLSGIIAWDKLPVDLCMVSTNSSDLKIGFFYQKRRKRRRINLCITWWWTLKEFCVKEKNLSFQLISICETINNQGILRFRQHSE